MQVEKTEPNRPIEANDLAAKAKPEGWAMKVAAPPRALTASEEEYKPRNLLQRIAPKSRKGRVVFAAVAAQGVSICFMSLAGMMFSRETKQATVIETALAQYIQKKREAIPAGESTVLGNAFKRKHWKGFFDDDPYKTLLKLGADDPKRYEMQAGKLLQFGVIQLADIVSTAFARKLFNDVLDTGVSDKNIIISQLADNGISIGTALLLPSWFPEEVRSLRKGVQNTVNAIPIGNPKARDNFAKSTSFAFVNSWLPNMLGFMVSLNTTLREVDAQEKARSEQAIQDDLGIGR